MPLAPAPVTVLSLSQWGWETGRPTHSGMLVSKDSWSMFQTCSWRSLPQVGLIWFDMVQCINMHFLKWNKTNIYYVFCWKKGLSCFEVSNASGNKSWQSPSQLWFIHGLAIHCSTMKEQTMTPAWHTPQFSPWPSKQIADHMALRTFMCSVWQNAEPRPSTSTWWTSSEWPKTTTDGYMATTPTIRI